MISTAHPAPVVNSGRVLASWLIVGIDALLCLAQLAIAALISHPDAIRDYRDILLIAVIAIPAAFALVVDFRIWFRSPATMRPARMAVTLSMLGAVWVSCVFLADLDRRGRAFNQEFLTLIVGIPLARAAWNTMYFAAAKTLQRRNLDEFHP